MSPANLHILLVEDDPAVSGMYKLKLEMDGYRVTVAADGEEGLRVARDDKPHMIFLDVRLPKMDGITVLEALRKDDHTRHIPVVILSNYGEPPLIERGLRLGAREYLLKSQTTPSGVSARAKSYAEPETKKKKAPEPA
jgi:CheY-like chemotaxis protein